MARGADILGRWGGHLLKARQDAGLSQAELAKRSSLAQAQLSYFEAGKRQPTLDQFLRIAKALDVSVQRLLSGSDRPAEGLRDLAVELRRLGIADLWVVGEAVPGGFRRPEEVIPLALSGHEPDPRVIEAIPAVLAWNEINPTLLRAYGAVTKTTSRLAWLADVALAIERQKGFPGGCRKEPLERFLKAVELAKRRSTRPTAWDSLGKPSSGPPTSPIWKRWNIHYDASLDEFEERALHLEELRKDVPGRRLAKRRLAQRLLAASRALRGGGDAAKGDTPAKQPSKTDAVTNPTTSEGQGPGEGDGHGKP